jgi:drug/metabolite transporter (DMT)-like permease
MSISCRLRVKTYVLIVLMVAFGALGDVLLGKGMRETGGIGLGSVRSFVGGIARGFHNDFVWVGILSLIAFFLCYMLVLSWADYSFVSPASAVSYAVVTFLGWALLRETVNSTRWLGVLVICLGVFLVGHTPTRTTTEPE